MRILCFVRKAQRVELEVGRCAHFFKNPIHFMYILCVGLICLMIFVTRVSDNDGSREEKSIAFSVRYMDFRRNTINLFVSTSIHRWTWTNGFFFFRCCESFLLCVLFFSRFSLFWGIPDTGSGKCVYYACIAYMRRAHLQITL